MVLRIRNNVEICRHFSSKFQKDFEISVEDGLLTKMEEGL